MRGYMAEMLGAPGTPSGGSTPPAFHTPSVSSCTIYLIHRFRDQSLGLKLNPRVWGWR